MTRIVVTGATGLIGKHAVAALVAQGHDVHAIARQIPKQSMAGVTWHEYDLLGAIDLDSFFSKIQATHLLHFAWVTDHGKFWNAPENFDWKMASKTLIKAFHKNGGIRVVMAGSCAEYDWNNLDDGICREQTTALKPHTLYGQAKLDTFRWLAEFSDDTDTSYAWGRVFLVFGTGEASERLVPSIIKALVSGQEAKCSSGTQVRDFLDAKNVGRAFAALLMCDVVGAVNVASGKARTIANVAKTLGEISGRADLIKLGALPDRTDDPAILVADVSRLENEVCFASDIDIYDSLAASYADINECDHG